MSHASDSRGLTLTEVTVVMVLASLVMFGLVGFYMASQATWIDASSQAIAQREGTALLRTLSDKTHHAGHAIVTTSGNSRRIDFYEVGNATPFWSMLWNGDEKKLYEGPYPDLYPGAATTCAVDAFDVSATPLLVDVTIGLVSAHDQHVAFSTRVGFNNTNAAP